MRRLQVSCVLAAGIVAGCQAIASSTTSELEDPSICDAVLPKKEKWNGKPPVPLPDQQGDHGTVLVFPREDDPDLLWAFSAEDGKLTGWIELPRAALGKLVVEMSSPAAAQVAKSWSGKPKASSIKVRVPKGPRLAVLAPSVVAEAKRDAAAAQLSEDEAEQCPGNGSGQAEATLP